MAPADDLVTVTISDTPAPRHTIPAPPRDIDWNARRHAIATRTLASELARNGYR